MPKLIILGTNDPYWTVDAVNFYFFDLKGEKYIHYVPNAGHGLNPSVAGTLSAFYHAVLNGKARPQFGWEVQENGDEVEIAINPKDAPKSVLLWTAQSADRDFRNERWSSKPVEGNGKGYDVKMPIPGKDQGFLALYAELVYASAIGHEYGLCTSVRIFGKDLQAPNGAAGK